MDDRPPRRDSDPPLAAEPDVPPRSFSRATRRAADLAPPPPREVHDFPLAFRELRRLTLEAETQFRWDSQQATWSQCAEHWRRRVHDMQLGDEDLDARMSRMLLARPPSLKRLKHFHDTHESYLHIDDHRNVLDLEASLKIDAQCAAWIDTQRQSWTEDVRDMGARVPFPLTNAQAVHRTVRFLDRLVASALPEAMKPSREGGWTLQEFELWSDRLRRVTTACENEMYVSNNPNARRIEETQTGRGRLAESVDRHPVRDRVPSRRASLAALGVSPPRPHTAAGSSVRRFGRVDDIVRNVRESLNASGRLTNPHGVFTSTERIAALRRDENYQALVNLYRDRMRNGTMPRGLYSGSGRDDARSLEQARDDPERDALIAATVSNMMRSGQVVSRDDFRAVANHGLENRPRVFPTRPETREARNIDDGIDVSSLSPPAPDSEEEGFDVPRSAINPTDPESEDDEHLAGDEPPRAARVLRTLEEAEHFFATLPPGAQGRLLVPDAATSGERERPVRATAGSDSVDLVLGLGNNDDGDVSSDPDDDSPPQLRRRVTEDGVVDAGPSGPECPPRERVDVDDAVSIDGVPVTCPATLRRMLAEARRAAEEADADAERAKDAVTCQICYANRRDALVMPCCHLLYCYRCVTRASEVAEARGHSDRCPCCRGPISGVLRCKLTE